MIRLAEYISKNYSGKVVEIGIGNYWKVADELARKGFEVIATDIKSIHVPRKIKFTVDDVSNPTLEVYLGAKLIYSIRPPFELFDSIKKLAEKIGADCIIKPLYGEIPVGKLVNFKGLSFYVWIYSKK